MSLRVCYAMSSTDMAYDTVSLRACYAMSNTKIYATSGTNFALGAYDLPTRCPVLTARISPGRGAGVGAQGGEGAALACR
eukprot:2038027-Rhodomonas_salina.2